MSYIKKDLPQAQVELVITVTPSEYEKCLQQAAVVLSEHASIKGFRPGKAPYEIVKQQLGEIKIMEQAMQSLVENNYSSVVKELGIKTIGMPEITVEKMAPGNDFVFKAIVSLLPEIKLGDLTQIKIQKKKSLVDEKKVAETLEHLKKMRAKEVIKSGKANKEDKITINMEMSLNKVPVEGGSAKNHGVYLSEPHYIPGLAEQLVGLQKDDIKEFNLKFPAEHYQKHLAGKNIDFKITVNDVFEMQYPELNDEFAKALGLDNMDKLKATLTENLQHEENQKEEQRIEIEIFDTIIDKSTFGEIPATLVEHEKHKMFHELKDQLSRQGIEMEKYLKDIKKTEQDIANDFSQSALKRVKAALVSREIALEQKLQPSDEEIKQEIDLIKKMYPDEKNVDENLKRAEVIETLAVAVQNRKVIKWLKEQVIKE